MRVTGITIALLLAALPTFAKSERSHSDYKLQFKQGQIRRVSMTEVLRLMMHFPQVDEDAAKPSIRTSKYSFTETVDTVFHDGAARITATLDSFQTTITIGDGPNAEQFFTFNSSNEHDLEFNFHDIKTLPRAQFLGQTLHFTMYPDGTVHSIENLQAFYNNAIGKGYDYDMVHAMLSLADSLRIGQLLELGSGGLAATMGKSTSPTTATEIPVSRTFALGSVKANKVNFRTTYFNPPAKIDYLEGIATPLGIEKFAGGGVGEITLEDHFITHSEYRDTANILLDVDIDKVPEEITRLVTMDVNPVKVLRGGTVTLEEKEEHRGVLKDPTKISDPNTIVIDPLTGKQTPLGQSTK